MKRKLLFGLLSCIILTVLSCSPKQRPTTRSELPVKEVKSDNTNSSLRTEIVATAYHYLGSPYRYGGTTSKGFDCSGLIYATYGRYDFTLPRSAHDMMDYGKKINQRDALPGDLAFFKNVGRKIDHVAIVYKNDRSGIWLLHSTSSKGVVLQSLNQSDYWRKRLVQINRIIADKN